jgi:hypothetical protein
VVLLWASLHHTATPAIAADMLRWRNAEERVQYTQICLLWELQHTAPPKTHRIYHALITPTQHRESTHTRLQAWHVHAHAVLAELETANSTRISSASKKEWRDHTRKSSLRVTDLAVCRGKYTSKHGDSSRQLCTCKAAVLETIEHFYFECAAYAAARQPFTDAATEWCKLSAEHAPDMAGFRKALLGSHSGKLGKIITECRSDIAKERNERCACGEAEGGERRVN